MNLIFKNALAMTLLLSVAVAVPGSYVNQKAVDFVAEPLASLNGIAEGIKNVQKPLATEVVKPAAWTDSFKIAFAGVKTKVQELSQPCATRAQELARPYVAQAKDLGERVLSPLARKEGISVEGSPANVGKVLAIVQGEDISVKKAIEGATAVVSEKASDTSAGVVEKATGATSEIVENALLKDWFSELEGSVDTSRAVRKAVNDETISFSEAIAQVASVDKAKDFSGYVGGYLTRDNAILGLGILAAAYGAYQLYIIESESDEETQQ